VNIRFEVWGFQTRVEDYAHKAIRDILLLGHRQAFAWIDEWFGMTVDDVREYERQMQEETNLKVLSGLGSTETEGATTATTKDKEEGEENEDDDDEEKFASAKASPTSKEAPAPLSPTTSQGPNTDAPAGGIAAGLRSWLTWS